MTMQRRKEYRRLKACLFFIFFGVKKCVTRGKSGDFEIFPDLEMTIDDAKKKRNTDDCQHVYLFIFFFVCEEVTSNHSKVGRFSC